MTVGLKPELAARLVALRHDLHRRPELAFEEHETAARLEVELGRLDPLSLERVAGTGLVARFAGRDRSRPPIIVRGDIDALPIDEATGAAFSSEIPGRMHACGHDVHASWTVGAAALLAAEPAACDVLVLLQPAEEVADGAAAVLATGVLDGAAAIFGAHVDLRFPLGKIVAQAGPLAASADIFRLTLTAPGAHGARPHESADPVVGAAALVMALQTVVARRIDPSAPAVLTVGELQAGAAHNVIPSRAHLAGTLRATDPKTRTTLVEEVERIARGVAATHGLGVEVEIEIGPPPLVNDERAAAWATQAVVESFGESALVPFGMTNLASEDFAFYLERMPGCFLRIGSRPEGAPVVAAHSPRFLPADEAIGFGAVSLAQAARVAARG
ncbi:MAG: M20 family metallopeptidase [Thermoanaerobaculia bacterium]|nr:M20 family metallopeptidase [Thermoanaerobaculia bacterium]